MTDQHDVTLAVHDQQLKDLTRRVEKNEMDQTVDYDALTAAIGKVDGKVTEVREQVHGLKVWILLGVVGIGGQLLGHVWTWAIAK
jgi:hypothetical protein